MRAGLARLRTPLWSSLRHCAILFHRPGEGESQKGNTKQTTFKSLKSDSKVTNNWLLDDFMVGSPFTVPLLLASDLLVALLPLRPSVSRSSRSRLFFGASMSTMKETQTQRPCLL